MVKDRVQTEQPNISEEADGNEEPPRYFIDSQAAEARSRSLPMLVAARLCYSCRQADEVELSASSKAQPIISRIVKHCSKASDYLPPDTPLKEAIFRVLLAGGNRPMAPEEVSQVLSEKWELTPFPRDLNPGVIQRLLDHSEAYCLTQLPAPEE